jgi:hypothetical protein
LLGKYDSIQFKAPWIRKRTEWLSITYAFNATKRPLFDSKEVDKAYLGEYVDNHHEIVIAYNFLWNRPRTNWYIGPGINWNTMRGFDKLELTRYQRSKGQGVGKDSIQAVVQSEVYDSKPNRLTRPSLQVVGSLYFTKARIGIEAVVKNRFRQTDGTGLNGSIGVYFPIKMGETALVLMPQLRLKRMGESNLDFWKEQATFGFSISAALLPFMIGKN